MYCTPLAPPLLQDTRQLQSLLPEKLLDEEAPAVQAYLQLLRPRGVQSGFDAAWCPAAYTRPDADMVKGLGHVQVRGRRAS